MASLRLGDMGVEIKPHLAQRREAQIVGRRAFALQRLADHGEFDRMHQRDERRVIDRHLFGLLIQRCALAPDRVAICGGNQIVTGLDLVIMPPAFVENALEI